MADTRSNPMNAEQKGAASSKNQGPNANRSDPANQGSNLQNRQGQTPRSGITDACGPARRVSDIQPQMDVVSSCGCTMGKVDQMDGNSIKLTKNDSPDGQHHYIPTDWVERVDDHVHLTKNAEETQQEWKSDAASGAGFSA